MKTSAVLQERGQITLPKRVREELHPQPGARIEVEVIPGGLLLRKPKVKLNLDKWHGYLRARYKELGFSSVDELVTFVRDRDR
jgi:AbrB family looped-hinge helix DNA binding protein